MIKVECQVEELLRYQKELGLKLSDLLEVTPSVYNRLLMELGQEASFVKVDFEERSKGRKEGVQIQTSYGRVVLLQQDN